MRQDQSTWGLVRDARAPLTGRDEEMAALDAALDLAVGGEARVVSLFGPAGIGKTRLIQDLVIRHRAQAGALVPRVYRGSARDATATYGLFARLLRARFGLVEGMDPEAAKAQVRAQAAKVLDDRKVGDVIYFLGQFLGLAFDESPLTRAVADDPSQAEMLRRAVVRSFLEADAAHSPLCLVFEDLHLASDESLVLVRHLLEHISGPILVLCAARPELLTRQEDWGRVGERRHIVLELPPLKDADAVAVMEALLAPCEGGPPAQLVEAACAFAGGTPLLLEQMLRIYHDKGVLAEESELSLEPSWRVDLDKLVTARLPITIEDAVNARIAALEPSERRILEQAAVMGGVFWTGAFVAIARMGREPPPGWGDEAGGEVDADAAEIQQILEDLVDRDYVLALPDSSFSGSNEYVFKHNKEREAIGKRTSPAAQKRHHQAIAEWLEHQAALRASDEYIAMLAEHREKGGDAIRAGLAFLEAGDAARKRYANARANTYYHRGLELLGDAHPGRRINALHDLGDVLVLSGRVDEALAAFREMLTLAYRLDLRRKAGAANSRIGRLYRDTGSLDDASTHLTIAMRLFESAGDERGVASTIDDIGKLFWHRGEYGRALESLREGLERREELGDPRSIAVSLNNLGMALQDTGRFREARESFDAALAIRRTIGDLVGIVTSLNNLGTVAQDQRDFERALTLFQEALEVARQVGDNNRIALVLTNIGECHYRNDRADEAIKVLGQAEGLCDELGDKLGLAEALRALGKAHLVQGDLGKARDAIGRAVDLFASLRSKVHLGSALRTLGEITAAGGWGSAHTKNAKEYFARSVSIFEETGNEVELARTFKVFARFLVSEDEFAADESAGREARSMNERADAIFGRLDISWADPSSGKPTRASQLPPAPAS